MTDECAMGDELFACDTRCALRVEQLQRQGVIINQPGARFWITREAVKEGTLDLSFHIWREDQAEDFRSSQN